ncbi:MAG: hypothetical protein R3C05_09590 [Pirellulaceae bacterium]
MSFPVSLEAALRILEIAAKKHVRIVNRNGLLAASVFEPSDMESGQCREQT